MQFCDRYEIVEKPYSIIIASTTIFAVIDFALKQISCKVAPADAQMNQVGFGHLGFGTWVLTWGGWHLGFWHLLLCVRSIGFETRVYAAFEV